MNVVSQFLRIVAAHPEAIALEADGNAWSYRALDAVTTAWAEWLQGEGVTAGSIVAFALDRSFEAAAIQLAILKAGAVYAPLDPVGPRPRWERMVRTLGRPFVLSTDPDLAQAAVSVNATVLAWPIPASTPSAGARVPVAEALTPDSPAYVMFTSGSTGEPKGVLVPHRGIVRLVDNVSYVQLGPGRSLLQAAPLSFDAATFELWGAWLTGGRCVIHPERIPTAAGIGAALRSSKITTLWLTAGLFNAIIDEDPTQLVGVDELLIGGEALSVSHVKRAQAALPTTVIINGYGPTETTTFAATYRIPPLRELDIERIPIGTPIPATTLAILDENGHEVAVGEVGELYVGGDGVALGYIGQPSLSAERFVADPQVPNGHRYRTGDLVKKNRDGFVEYVGRRDGQLKISGHRIEPGEIEQLLCAVPGIAAAAVIAVARAPELPRQLTAFVVLANGASPTAEALRGAVRAQLPAPMVPSVFKRLDALPLTTNGKIDRLRLSAMHDAPELTSAASTTSAHSASALEATLLALWEQLLGRSITPDDNVFDCGASSLLVIRAVARLATRDGIVVPAIAFFEHPTVRGLARSLRDTPSARKTVASVRPPAVHAEDRRVAIVGAAVRYPGAPTLADFWRLLCGTDDAITHFGDAALDPSVSADDRADPAYVRARGVLENVDQFDAAFFGMSAREAQLTDPQQRLWLELAWEALEDAGLVAQRAERVVGVFGGVYNSAYLSRATATRPDLVQQYGEFNAMLLNEKDYVAPRVAHKLGLRGPAISVHTACSTSLVAICQAVQSLRDGSCDVALAGGVSLTLPTRSGYRYLEGSMLSPDGATRPFDVNAQGTVFSDGAGVVALKRYEDAIRDGDQIYAVIRGVGINNDGAGKASFTAPSVVGQVEVLRRALSDAGVAASAISFVEAHGTATPLGDPMEVEALRRVFVADGAAPGGCRLGSVKGHLGHTVIGAGVAGLLKTALALRNEQLPGTAHHTAPHAALALEGSPFRVSATPESWPRSETPRLAGVSSFGVGGTNAHIILEEPPAQTTPGVVRGTTAWPFVLPLSARSESALTTAQHRLADVLVQTEDEALRSIASTLQSGRALFAHRRAVIGSTRSVLVDALATSGSPAIVNGTAQQTATPVAMLFPGQGAQYAAMGRALYHASSMFREAFDRCAAVAARDVGIDLRRAIDCSDGAQLRETATTQPAIFATSYATAMLWQSWGVVPSVFIGHSIGEFVAAALAGVFSVEDGMRMVCARGRMMQALPPGRMLAVALSADEVVAHLPPSVSVAAHNAPAQSVVSGPAEAIEALHQLFEARGINCRPLATSHAFHSPMMDRVIEPFGAVVHTVSLRAPHVPIYSTVTGELLTAEAACDPSYWAHHLRATVKFTTAVTRAIGDGHTVMLEVGPGATLSRLARRQGAPTPVRTVASLPEANTPPRDAEQMVTALGQLWCWGVDVRWDALQGSAPRPIVRSLPTYPFERSRCWVDPRDGVVAVPLPPSAESVMPLVSDVAPSVATMTTPPVAAAHNPRAARLLAEVQATIEDVSGETLTDVDPATSFTRLGLDSLVLTQVALALSRRYGVRIAFRQLLESMPSIRAVAEHLDGALPPEVVPVALVAPAVRGAPMTPAPMSATTSLSTGPASAMSAGMADVFVQQVQLLQRQLDMLAGLAAGTPMVLTQPTASVAVATPQPVNGTAPAAISPPTVASTTGAGDVVQPAVGPTRDVYDATKAFGAAMRVTLTDHSGDLSPRQRARLDAFVRRYTARTAGSKRYTAEHRAGMADPRVATGFRPLTKELVYPIVVTRSSGARVWDVDDNEYIDVLSGFGSNLLGWTSPVVVEAITAQMAHGFEVGPQHVLAGEVGEKFRAMTGSERVAFCNTGSEAVLGAIRIARTVTGRPLVAIFSGSYHGINDEVIVRARKDHHAVPAAPGIMSEATENVLILEYGTPESLAILEARADDIAAVIVEPVQSRRPDFQPREFLASVRELTTRTGMVYIWDEIVTGFRAAPGGAQEHFGIRADLATYGKIVGGGLPIGVIAGKREFMDALDGGAWQYGDASVPEVGVTYFAGTFVRHPLALAAANAMLDELARRGPELQRALTQRTTALAASINERAKALGVPIEVRHFASIWKTFVTAPTPHSDLLFYALRERGLHIYDGFPCFMTAAHGDDECEAIIDAFDGAMDEMREGGFLPVSAATI